VRGGSARGESLAGHARESSAAQPCLYVCRHVCQGDAAGEGAGGREASAWAAHARAPAAG
jgi:hypothetical protein